MGCINSEKDITTSTRLHSIDEEEIEAKIQNGKRPSVVVALKAAHAVKIFHQVNDFWENFEFKENIGIGLQAKHIYIVVNKTSNLSYVVKVVDDEQVFQSEVKMVSRFLCPYILRFKEAYRDKKSCYILYEYSVGDYLLNRIISRSKYNEHLASKTVYMMLHAVKYLHDKNIIHRDIRPDSFFYSSKQDSDLKLMEFGFAMDVLPNSMYEFCVGSPCFMSPEIVENKEKRSGEICKKGDVWSLGICVFLMLCGQLPFTGLEESDIFQEILTKEIKFKKGISKEAMDLVRKMLHRDPSKRLSADEALEHSWIKNNDKSDNEMLHSTVEGLRVFHAKNFIGRALEQIAADNVNARDETHFKELFNRFDSNGDGCITREECVQALLMDQLNKDRVESIVDELFTMSGEQTNLICYENFREMMVLQHLTNDVYMMDAVFSALDVNDDGYISLQRVYCISSSVQHSNNSRVCRKIQERRQE